jgi:hypothetical protein
MIRQLERTLGLSEYPLALLAKLWEMNPYEVWAELTREPKSQSII